MSLYLTIISIVLLAPSCLGSHFRGGFFTWISTEQQSQIKISYRLSWRRSYSSDHFCDSSHISSGDLRPGEGSLICSRGCIGTVTELAYRCTDFSETEDWTTGTRTFLYNLTTASPEISLM
ncbi:hypothetical protein CHS0354_033343 [Potamilus streckersoni]|uniref:Uncharacterized protein n=1 Tax=Potamilus streckersoni TaxID=2493646 RepID=A0AAE0RTZ2_9BIVA|nr:hypothetical protein CHS0354_033343 [Potamilus streckersoni]